MILLYEARVTNSLLDNIVTLRMDCSAGFRGDLRSLLPNIRSPQGVRCKNCLTFHIDDGFSRISLTVNFLVTFYWQCQILAWHRSWQKRSHLWTAQILATVQKIMNVFVRAFTKWHIPESHVRKSGCRLENCRVFCVVCVDTRNRIRLTLYDVINHRRHIRFQFVRVRKKYNFY